MLSISTPPWLQEPRPSVTECGLREAALTGATASLPDAEIEESDIPSSFNNVAPDGSIVRNLDTITVYNATYRRPEPLEALLQPGAINTEDIVVFATVLSPLPNELGVTPHSKPKSVEPGLLRQAMIVRSSKQQLNIKLPEFNPDVSREDAYAAAKELHDAAVLPLVVGTVKVVNLGTLVSAKEYHTHNHLFPLGFRSSRMYSSVLQPDQKVSYTSEILEGLNGPRFMVTHEGGAPVFEASSSSAVWLQVLRAVNDKRTELGLQNKGTAISGPEMMGFANKKIAAILEGMDGVLDCQQYVFRAQRVGNTAPTASGHSRKRKATKTYNQETAKAQTITTAATKHTKASKTQSDFDVLKEGSKELSSAVKHEIKALGEVLDELEVIASSVSVQDLFESGLGKLVNRLRKHHDEHVSQIAKRLKRIWQSSESPDSETTPSSLLSLRDTLVSYIGFGDEEIPANYPSTIQHNTTKQSKKSRRSSSRHHKSKSRKHNTAEEQDGTMQHRVKLLRVLEKLNRVKKVTLDDVVDTQVGKRVNKLRKHLDPNIAKLAATIKSKWKQQLEQEESPTEPADTSPSSHKKKHKHKKRKRHHTSPEPTQEETQAQPHTTKPGTPTKDKTTLLSAYSSLERQRVSIGKVISLEITIGTKHNEPVLYFTTLSCRYNITCFSSDVYYPLYHTLWSAFSTISLSAMVAIQYPTHNLSQALNTIQQHTIQQEETETEPMVLQCPRSSSQQTPGEELQAVSLDDVLVYRRAVVCTVLSAVGKDGLNKSVFIKELLKQEVANKKSTLSKEEQFRRKVKEGIGLPDDLDVLNDTTGEYRLKDWREPTQWPKPTSFVCDWSLLKQEHLHEDTVIQHLQNTIQNNNTIRNTTAQNGTETNTDASDNSTKQHHTSDYSTLLSLWTFSRGFYDAENEGGENNTDFFNFRSRVQRGRESKLPIQYINTLLEDSPTTLNNTTAATTQPNASQGVTTRRSAPAVTIKEEVNVLDDVVSTYAYNLDELWPAPVELITSTSWPEVCRRLCVVEKIQSASTQNTIQQVTPIHEIDLLITCDELLTELMSNPLATPFCVPVDPIQHNAPNYFDLIKRPMDLSTIQKRLHSGHYNVENKAEGVDYNVYVNADEVDEAEQEMEQDTIQFESLSEWQRKKQQKAYFAEQRKLLREKAARIEKQQDELLYKHDCRGGGHLGFAADVRQVWVNCELFNDSRAPLYLDSVKLKRLFINKYNTRVINRQNNIVCCRTSSCDRVVDGVVVDSSELQWMAWLMDRVLDTSVVRNAFIQRVETVKNLEKDEVKLLSDIKKSSSEDHPALQDSLETCRTDLERHSIRIQSIGRDRYYNEYFIIPSIVNTTGLVLVNLHNTKDKTPQWAYYDKFSQVETLLQSLDIRGNRENGLFQCLNKSWKPYLQKHMDANEIKFDRAVDTVLGIRDEARDAAEDDRIQALIDASRVDLLSLEKEKSVWGTAHSEDGKIYYYHRKTRETTWEAPEIFEKVKEQEGKIKLLQNEKDTFRLAKPADVELGDGLLAAYFRRKGSTTAAPASALTSIQQSSELATLRYKALELLCAIVVLERLTVSPESRPNLCPWKDEWVQAQRAEWLTLVDNFRTFIEKEDVGKDWKVVLEEFKKLLKTLFKCYCGDPYTANNVKTQEAIVRAVQHKFRWSRTVDSAKSLAQLGLMQAQLRYIIKHKNNAKYRNEYKTTLDEFTTAIV